MKNSNKNLKAVLEESPAFIAILSTLFKLLQEVGHNVQAACIERLIKLLKEENIPSFITVINSVDMWGGSGAVWEVGIENPNQAKKFEYEIISLIDLMENSGIMGNGIKPVRKIFVKNLEKK